MNIYQTLKTGYTSDLWYDWFCNEKSLDNKGERLLIKLKSIAFSDKFDITQTYVFFKNNCPLNGTLYDDFRICDIENKEVIYTVVPRCGHKSSNGKGAIWGKENNFEGPLFEGTWTEIKQWFNGENK